MAQNDDAEDAIEFETDSGNHVTVTADSGVLHVSLDGDSIAFETTARLTTERGVDVLDCGQQRTKDDEKIHAYTPVGSHKTEIEQLREGSKDDSPLTYEVVEHTKTSRAGGWGKREITKQKLTGSKSYVEMSEREKELSRKVNTDRVPDDAEPGDVLTLEDLLGDTRTDEEKEQDALDEADETGEEVVISKTTTDCNDPSRECSLDHVARVATPEGDVENRRTHTY